MRLNNPHTIVGNHWRLLMACCEREQIMQHKLGKRIGRSKVHHFSYFRGSTMQSIIVINVVTMVTLQSCPIIFTSDTITYLRDQAKELLFFLCMHDNTVVLFFSITLYTILISNMGTFLFGYLIQPLLNLTSDS